MADYIRPNIEDALTPCKTGVYPYPGYVFEEGESETVILAQHAAVINRILTYLDTLAGTWESYFDERIADYDIAIKAYIKTQIDQVVADLTVTLNNLQAQITVLQNRTQKNEEDILAIQNDIIAFKEDVAKKFVQVYIDLKKQYDNIMEIIATRDETLRLWVEEKLAEQLEEFNEILSKGYMVLSPITKISDNIDKVVDHMRIEYIADYNNLICNEMAPLNLTMGEVSAMQIPCGKLAKYGYAILYGHTRP